MKRFILLVLILLFNQLLLFAELGEAEVSMDFSWGYFLEYKQLKIRVPGADEESKLNFELHSLEGKIDALDSSISHGFSYDAETNIQETYVVKEVYFVPLTLGNLTVQVKVTDLENSQDTRVATSRTVTILPQPQREGGARTFMHTHPLKNEAYPGEEILLSYELFSDDEAQNNSSVFPALTGFKVRFTNPFKERYVYLDGLVSHLSTLPTAVLSFGSPGTILIPAEEFTLSFKKSGSGSSYAEQLSSEPAKITVLALPENNEFKGDFFIGSSLAVQLQNYPEIVDYGQPLSFDIILEGSANIQGLKSLRPYFKFPRFLKEQWSGEADRLEDSGQVHRIYFHYTGIARSLLGLKLPSVKIPFFNTQTGEYSYVVKDLDHIKANLPKVLVWTSLLLLLLITGAVALFVMRAVKRDKKKSVFADSGLNSDIPLEDDFENIFLEFIQNYKLTHREKEILEILVEGKSTKEIAGRLYISPETAKKHIRNIMKKTKTHSRYEIYVLLNEHLKRK